MARISRSSDWSGWRSSSRWDGSPRRSSSSLKERRRPATGTKTRFSETLDYGLKILNDGLADLRAKGQTRVPGDLIFKLYDTYGFPVDIVQDVVRDEDLDLDIEGFHLFSVTEFPDRREYTFWEKANLDIDKIKLTEGKRLKWFSEWDTKSTELASGFNEIVEDFFKKAPYG